MLKAEGRIILLEKNRDYLISVQAAREFVSKCIVPLTIWLGKLADAGRNSDEKGLLEGLGKRVSKSSRPQAKEALDFNGK